MEMTAVVCNTPLQIMWAIDIAVNNVESCSGNIELFLINGFKNAAEINNKITRIKIFNYIYFCNLPKMPKKFSKIKAFKILRNSKFCLEMYGIKDETKLRNRYSKIFIADANPLGLALHDYNRNAEVILYDDGTETYDYNPLTFRQSILYLKISKLLNIGINTIDVHKLYIGNKELCNSPVADIILQLPRLIKGNSALDLLSEVFPYNQNTYIKRKKFIILGMMVKEMDAYNNQCYDILFPKTKQDLFLFRKHPRQGDIGAIEIQKDDINNMWELECLKSITDDHVLIAPYSTSQLSPKMIADKNPYIIFTYKLFVNVNKSHELYGYENMISRLKKCYSDPNKIYVPENIEEYNSIIMELA